MSRDLRGDVLAALFDRVEEPRFPSRQQEILEIFQMLLPNFLSRGALRAAGEILEEITRLLASKDALRPEQRATAEDVLHKVSAAETLKELDSIDRPALVSLAVKIGATRLIDNTVLR